MSTRNLEEAIAFVLQGHERVIAARLKETLLRKFAVEPIAIQAAERATMDASNTLDAATQELADTIRDMIEHAVVRAVAAMEPSVVVPPGAPYSLTQEVERA